MTHHTRVHDNRDISPHLQTLNTTLNSEPGTRNPERTRAEHVQPGRNDAPHLQQLLRVVQEEHRALGAPRVPVLKVTPKPETRNPKSQTPNLEPLSFSSPVPKPHA
jgi:hypothetical protein